ncbi:MAG: LiaI-LiaF-like domain-containing protein [Terriglobales bacterium]
MDNYQPNQTCYCTRCRSRGLMGPAVLITLGVLFMLSEFEVASFHSTWPILLIVIGLVKVLAGNLDTSGHMDVIAPAPPGAPPAPTQNSEPRQVDHV